MLLPQSTVKLNFYTVLFDFVEVMAMNSFLCYDGFIPEAFAFVASVPPFGDLRATGSFGGGSIEKLVVAF